MEYKKVQDKLRENIKNYSDYPKKGILFRDLNPIFRKPELFHLLINYMCEQANKLGRFDYILGVEARGFIIASALAQNLDCGFVPIRKKGKLPGNTNSVEYDLEYGRDCLEIQVDEELENARVLVIDDIFATGGTLNAVLSLLEPITANTCFGVVLDIGISDIKGLKKDHFVVLDDA
jgi:adenine phosphoribosyltransferase